MLTNAVLHDFANAVRKLIWPNASFSAFWKLTPPAFWVAGQETGVSSVKPFCSAAVAVTILKVEPGGKRPVRPFPAAARIAPVRVSSSTIEAGLAELAATPSTV